MKKDKILLIDMCEDDLHSLEFVKPIEDILIKEHKEYFVKKYFEINQSCLEKCSHLIISGNSLMDKDYLNYKEDFSFLKEFDKPVLGICAGMQIILLTFGGRLVKSHEIGAQEIFFKENFLGLDKKADIYLLHNYSVENIKDFEIFAKSKNSIQAVKHKNKKIYGVMFHPEVRNNIMIVNFLK